VEQIMPLMVPSNVIAGTVDVRRIAAGRFGSAAGKMMQIYCRLFDILREVCGWDFNLPQTMDDSQLEGYRACTAQAAIIIVCKVVTLFPTHICSQLYASECCFRKSAQLFSGGKDGLRKKGHQLDKPLTYLNQNMLELGGARVELRCHPNNFPGKATKQK